MPPMTVRDEKWQIKKGANERNKLEAGKRTNDTDTADSRKLSCAFLPQTQKGWEREAAGTSEGRGSIGTKWDCKNELKQLDPRFPPCHNQIATHPAFHYPKTEGLFPSDAELERNRNSETAGAPAGLLEKGLERKFTYCMARSLLPFPPLL